MGTPSSTIIQKTSSDQLSLAYRFTNIPSDTDLIIIHAGINDWSQVTNNTIGDKNSTDSTTLYGALNNILHGLNVSYPAAHKLFITPIRPNLALNTNESWGINFLEFSDIISERCKYHAIPILDFTNEGYDSSISEVRAMYTDGGVHPNEAGHQYLYEMISARIELI